MRLPVCGCGRVMDCTKTGLTVMLHTEDQQPYQLWASDEYTCGTCFARVSIIQSEKPIAEYWQSGFEATVRGATTPDGKQRLMKGYYRRLPDGAPITIAGVGLPNTEFPGVPLSTVDSTTQTAQTPSTTEAPPAAAPQA